MTKRSDALAKAVSGLVPKFRVSGSFLYHRDPILMIRGFAFDMPPGGCYIWKYYVPLFQDVEFLHMSLGYRVDGGYIETRWKSTSQLATEASALVLSNDDFGEQESLQELIDFAKDRRIDPASRVHLHGGLRVFESESLESIIIRADATREKLGIA